MTILICTIYFVILSFLGFYLLYKPYGVTSVPFHPYLKMKCTGMELLVVFMFATGFMGIIPLLSVRLAILEIICILGILRCQQNVIISPPMILFMVFLCWVILGITYTPNPVFGLRMLTKYLYPLLFAMLTASVIRDPEVFLKSALWARWIALISLLAHDISIIGGFFPGIFWTAGALCTSYITMTMFSLAMFFNGQEKLKNLLWAVVFMLPCIMWVIRTDIFGTGLALSTFFFIKYKFKSLPLILAVGCLGIAALFYIPSVKSKMYYRPDEVTLTDFLTNNVDENNINTSGRKKGWEDVHRFFFTGHELVGSGTGRVQTFFYTEVIGWQRGGQLHNDFLVLLCDNGMIGLLLFVIAYIAIMFHCLYIYHKSREKWVRLCALTAGSALIGILVTMYSDNTISYSMCTLGYPWGFYGMALGLYKKERMGVL